MPDLFQDAGHGSVRLNQDHCNEVTIVVSVLMDRRLCIDESEK
jgi:hypothetical protein